MLDQLFKANLVQIELRRQNCQISQVVRLLFIQFHLEILHNGSHMRIKCRLDLLICLFIQFLMLLSNVIEQNLR